MMDYLVNNFESFANIYMQVVIELYFFLHCLLLAHWLKPFVEKKKAAYISALVYFILLSLNSHISIGKEIERSFFLILLVLSIFTAWILDRKRNPIQKAFLFMVFRLISWLTAELFSEVGFFERDLVFTFDWYKNSVEVIVIEFILWNLIQYGLSLLLLYLVISLLHKAYKSKRDELTWREFIMLLAPAWTLLLVKPIMSSYFNLWFDGIRNGSIQENIPASPYRILFCLFSFLPIITVIMFYQQLKEKQEAEYVRKSIDERILDTRRHLGHIEEVYEKMREIRHDLGNHLTVIEGLAEKGENRELIDYINEFKGRYEDIQPVVKTGNAVTDVILSELAEHCSKEGIQFECEFQYPAKLAINPFDMSVVLSNALQNAVEASVSVEHPHIVIKSLLQEMTFIINVRNRESMKAAMGDEGLPLSTKEDSGHGYGLKNIRAIAKKYKGGLEIRQEGEGEDLYFVLNVLLMG
ncbi:MAG: GHKL domain-containing protein [Lachnospiraceae bacterium]|nr:GHKL domain-containing protein [Lachnospiraceae bacterium]